MTIAPHRIARLRSRRPPDPPPAFSSHPCFTSPADLTKAFVVGLEAEAKAIRLDASESKTQDVIVQVHSVASEMLDCTAPAARNSHGFATPSGVVCYPDMGTCLEVAGAETRDPFDALNTLYAGLNLYSQATELALGPKARLILRGNFAGTKSSGLHFNISADGRTLPLSLARLWFHAAAAVFFGGGNLVPLLHSQRVPFVLEEVGDRYQLRPLLQKRKSGHWDAPDDLDDLPGIRGLPKSTAATKRRFRDHQGYADLSCAVHEPSLRLAFEAHCIVAYLVALGEEVIVSTGGTTPLELAKEANAIRLDADGQIKHHPLVLEIIRRWADKACGFLRYREELPTWFPAAAERFKAVSLASPVDLAKRFQLWKHLKFNYLLMPTVEKHLGNIKEYMAVLKHCDLETAHGGGGIHGDVEVLRRTCPEFLDAFLPGIQPRREPSDLIRQLAVMDYEADAFRSGFHQMLVRRNLATAQPSSEAYQRILENPVETAGTRALPRGRLLAALLKRKQQHPGIRLKYWYQGILVMDGRKIVYVPFQDACDTSMPKEARLLEIDL